MTDQATIDRFLASPGWTYSEKFVIKWQYQLLGEFETALMGAIKRADEANLYRLEIGFPIQVQGFRQWTHSDLGVRLRAAGLEI